ncbi:TIGR03086 family metal-binding protein [Nocardia sp. CDC159]|uniref:TIGR03086 family metal-binding protein n=1 Tax=Nocardia pulmonis TaxID=2951408 RepID=A0A9X2IWG8_9NOCA|nr:MULTISPECIES: TIGR03086 family metal-binding protein [Nocardia]MCM6774922.1 TIGR03086 family metal-binding protein [Nocardia pulmonis]MCM6789853.1 TIGR03086 family metal-binding protein [Nocardia sp. CDC159]
MFDMESAAAALESVVAGIADEQLELPTPCADTTVRDLLVHVVGLTEAFRQAATKGSVGRSEPPQVGPQAPLVADWRTRIPAQLKALVAAWRDPAAWEGETEAGGVTMPAAVMALVALDEVIVHGWDLARATGQDYHPAAADLTLLLDFLREFPSEGTPGMFGPHVPVPADAPLLHRVLGRTGRDPNHP